MANDRTKSEAPNDDSTNPEEFYSFDDYGPNFQNGVADAPIPSDNVDLQTLAEEYDEETAAEIAVPAEVYRESGERRDTEDFDNEAAGGRTMGFIALALSILSLFILPVVLGATGIIMGFVARSRGFRTLGMWSIIIGAVSVILGMFILPFMR